MNVENYETTTFSMNSRFIEGYLCKEIEAKGLLRRTKRHLRYFRIVFSTGKLNIKQCRTVNEMRSFQLKDILRVEADQLTSRDN